MRSSHRVRTALFKSKPLAARNNIWNSGYQNNITCPPSAHRLDI